MPESEAGVVVVFIGFLLLAFFAAGILGVELASLTALPVGR